MLKPFLNFVKLNTVAQQREAVTRGRSLLPYRLRYIKSCLLVNSYDLGFVFKGF
ncbi:MAG: hypothetical protein LBK06_10570 [Planctomycetaceae bacterium]|nr:hypothetical protein [Planctomycetaceae bacterium]